MQYDIIYSTSNTKDVKFKARLVGIINNEETRALLNTANAPKAVFTSASLNPNKDYTNATGKRLVLASTTLKKHRRVLIVTPEVSFISFRYSGGKKSICFHTVAHDEFAIMTDDID